MANNFSGFNTTSNFIEQTSKSLRQPKDQLSSFPQEPFGMHPDAQTRLLQIESKLNHLQTHFIEAFSRLESTVARCQQTIESFKSITSQIEGFAEDHQRNMIIKVKFGQSDSNAPTTPESTLGSRPESLAEHILTGSSTTEPEFKKVGGSKRLGRVYSRIKQTVGKVFSGPCVVTPILEIYPARMFQKPDAAKSGGHQ